MTVNVDARELVDARVVALTRDVDEDCAEYLIDSIAEVAAIATAVLDELLKVIKKDERTLV
jgi:hypothetical protein